MKAKIVSACIVFMCLGAVVLSASADGIQANVAFHRTGYQVGSSGTVLLEVTNETDKPLRIGDACLVFNYVGSARKFSRALKEEVVIEKDAVWEEEITLKPFGWNAALGYYGVTLVLNTDAGRATFKTSGIVLYRQDARIEILDTDATVYSPGQMVRARAVVRNTGNRILKDTELRFTRGIPWINAYRDKKFGQGFQDRGSAPIPPLQPGETFRTGWIDVLRLPSEDISRPTIDRFVASLARVGDDWQLLDVEVTKSVYCQPWGYDGAPVYDSWAHLYKYLENTDYRRVSYTDLDEYDTLREAGKDIPRNWMGFAPHQDDELSFAFLIPESVRKGHNFHIVQVTSSDANCYSMPRLFGHITGPNDWRQLGHIRRQETLHALRHMGVRDEHVTFLGLPDGGSEQIFQRHPKPSDPYLSPHTCTDHVPYPFAYNVNMPYCREAVVAAFKELLLKHQPDDVFTCHPDERHVDHRYQTYFLLEAIKEIRESGGKVPTVHVWVTYQAGDFEPAPFEYESEQWGLSQRDAVLIHQASWAYQTQSAIAHRGGSPRSPEQLGRHRIRKYFVLKGY
ncbi:PIG-L deacetylase family protein [Candidatus Hydrogenedentota bacterium]